MGKHAKEKEYDISMYNKIFSIKFKSDFQVIFHSTLNRRSYNWQHNLKGCPWECLIWTINSNKQHTKTDFGK